MVLVLFFCDFDNFAFWGCVNKLVSCEDHKRASAFLNSGGSNPKIRVDVPVILRGKNRFHVSEQGSSVR